MIRVLLILAKNSESVFSAHSVFSVQNSLGFLALKLFAVSIGTSAAVAVAITLSVIVYQHSAPIVFEIHQHHTASSYFHYLHQYHSIDITSLTISLYIIKTLLNYDDWYIMSSHLLLFYQSDVHSHFHCSYTLPAILKIS